MKKSGDRDQQKISELLKKLQASYLGTPSKKDAKKKSEKDDDELAFHQKIASMLGKAASPKKKKEKKDARIVEDERAKEGLSPATTSVQMPVEEKEIPSDEQSPDAIEEKKELTPVEAEAPIKKEKKKRERKISAVGKPKKSDTSEPIPSIIAEESPALPSEEPKSTDAKAEAITQTSDALIAKAESTEPKGEQENKEVESPHLHPLEKIIPVALAQESYEEVEEESTESEETVAEAEAEKLVTKKTPTTSEKSDFLPSQEEKPTKAATESVEAESKASACFPKSNAIQKDEIELPSSNTGSDKSPTPVAKEKEEERSFNSIEKENGIPLEEQSNPDQPIVIKAPIINRRTTVSDKQDDSAIVIRPLSPKTIQRESIVIRPRTAPRETPVPIVQTSNAPMQPIKIGKEVSQYSETEEKKIPSDTKHEMKKEQSPPTEQIKAETPKKTPSISAIRQAPVQASVPTNKENPTSAAKKVAGVTLPTKKEISKVPAKRTSIKRKAATDKPLRSKSQDENLEEVLDETISEMPLIEEIPADEPEEIELVEKGSANQRRKKQTAEDENLTALEIVCKKSGLTADDIAMIFELGYENELGKIVGYENLKKLKSEHLKKVSQNDRKHYRTAFGYRGEEYAGTQNHAAVLAAYIHDRKFLIGKLCLSLLLSILLLFADMPSLIGGKLTALDSSHPWILQLLGLLMLSGVALLSLRQVNAGIRSFFKFSPTPYSIPALLLPFVLIYDVLSFFMQSGVLPVNFLVSTVFLLGTVCDVFRITCEMRALRICSADGNKQVLVEATPRKKKLRQGDKIVKVINDDLGENLYHAKSGAQTVGFFRRFNAMGTAARPFTVFIITMFALSTLVFFTTAVITSSPSCALSSFMSTLLLSTPTSAIFLFFYPISHANKILAKQGCTLIGEETVEELNRKKTIIFPESFLFNAAKRTELSIRTGDDFKVDLRLANILFRKLGGTMAQIGTTVTQDRQDPPVSIVRIQDNGAEAIVDNRYHLLIGNAAFLQRGGIRVPKESSDVALQRAQNTALMYLAVNGILKLSYEVEYSVNQKFEELIAELAESDTAVAIRTYDPNLNDEFLQKQKLGEADPIRVIKQGRFEEEKPLETADTGVVALNESTDLVYPVYAAKSIFNVRRFGLRIQLIASLLGSAAVILLTALGQASLIGILPVTLYHSFWLLVSVIATATEMNHDKLHL